MSKTTRPANAPTHEVFAVFRKQPEGKANWHKIGACWPHKKDDGFNVRLEFLPIAGQEIVIRKWKPKPDAATQEGGAA